MTRDRSPGSHASRSPAPTGDATSGESDRVPLQAIRVAFQDAVVHLEQGIAARDYYAANYWVARGRLHLLAVTPRLGAGAATSAEEHDEIERLRALHQRFERSALTAPEGGEPSMIAMSAWLAKVGARNEAEPDVAKGEVAVAPVQSPPIVTSPLRRENVRSDGISYGDVMDVAMGPLASWMLDQERKSSDPIHRTVAETLHDLTHDAPYLGGFAIGTAKGTTKALRDFLMGVPEAAHLLYELEKTLLFEGSIGLIHRVVDAVEELVKAAPQFALWFADKWNAPDSSDRGEFRGEVGGYGVTMVALAVVAAFAGQLAPLAGELAFVIRVIEAVDMASDITSVLRPLGFVGKGARATGEVAHGAGSLGRAAHQAETLGDLVSDAPHVHASIEPSAPHAPGLDAPPRLASLEAQLPSDLRHRVPIVENPDLPGTTVHVVYRDGAVHIEVGPDAQPRHVGYHVATARTLLKYEGVLGRLRRLLDAVLIKLRIRPGHGTLGFEARLELEKLTAIQSDLEAMQSRLESRLAAGADGLSGAQIEKELADVEAQLDTHRQSVDAFDDGHGHVAAEDTGELAALTTPSGKPDPSARPSGPPKKVNPDDAAENIIADTHENETALLLARNGYAVEQNPKVPGTKKPDYRIEGQIFDNYSPTNADARNIWGTIQNKTRAAQARRFVITLDSSPATVEALRAQFAEWKIDGLEQALVVKDGQVVQIWP